MVMFQVKGVGGWKHALEKYFSRGCLNEEQQDYIKATKVSL